MRPRLLIVESDTSLRADLKRVARRSGYEAQSVGDSNLVRGALAERCADLILLDVSDANQLSAVQEFAGSAAVVAMSANPSAEMVVEVMKRGACDFLRKPFGLPALEEALAAAFPASVLGASNLAMTTRDPAMSTLMRQAEIVARSDVTLQIVGESGAGKDVLARFAHLKSRRRNGPLVVVSCAALPETLVDSELFGHQPGAFTGATSHRLGQVRSAEGGTLVLEDISEASPGVQAKLLRLLQEREVLPLGALRPVPVDIRVVSTTRYDLASEVENGRLREDLYFRLEVVVLQIPALRERPTDIGILAKMFLDRLAAANGSEPPILSRSGLKELERHPFRGNVRELENLMKRAAVLFPGREIDVGAILQSSKDREATFSDSTTLNLRELERRAIARSLEQTGGNRTRASRTLGISVRTLRNKIRRYGLA